MFKKTISIILTLLMLFAAVTVKPKIVSANTLNAITISNVMVNVNSSTNQVSVQGNISSGSGKNVALQVLAPDGTVDYVKQVTSSENGNFTCVFTVNSVQTGNYSMKIGTEGLATPYEKTFTLSGSGPIAPTVPTVPTNLTAAAGDTKVDLTWNAVIGATNYKVYEGTTSGSYGSTPVKVVSAASAQIAGLTNGTTYYFVVVASNAAGDSVSSNEVSVVPKAASNTGGNGENTSGSQTDSRDAHESQGSGSAASGTRTAEIVAGTEKGAVTIEIVRTVENGLKLDKVKLDQTKIAETIAQAVENNKTLATILVTDVKDNPADVLEVQIPKNAANDLASKGIALKIDTPKAKVEIPKETLSSITGDVKIDIKEVTDPSKIDNTKALVLEAVGDSKIVGNPVEIVSSYTGRTEITIPLKTENLPKDPEELKKVLESLAVYVQHSDGEKVTQKGEIVYDEKGNAIGISIWVDKFSTFTVVALSQSAIDKLNGASNTGGANVSEVPEIKFVGLGHSPLIAGDKEDFIISSSFNGNVQYRIYLNIDGTWQEVTNGYSAAVSGKETFSITPDYTFQNGQYQGRVYVKKAGVKGSKEENGIDFDNYYTYNINCVDRDDANRVYTTGKLLTDKDAVKVGEKVTISGVDGISGIEGPYFYRLSIYDVANDKWTNNVVPYSQKLEWTPTAAGTYVLDVHVITPNSVLWDNVQNDPTLIYGGYEGWKLKTVKVN